MSLKYGFIKHQRGISLLVVDTATNKKLKIKGIKSKLKVRKKNNTIIIDFPNGELRIYGGLRLSTKQFNKFITFM